MKPTKIATFVALSLFGAAAGAQTVEKSTVTSSTNPVTGAQTTTQTTTRTQFKTLDTNADGYLIVSEVPSRDPFANVFQAYDADGDKKVTLVEYNTWFNTKPAAATAATSTTTTTTTTTTKHPAFAVLDTDADGYIVVNEIPADNEFKTVWVKYDTDGDKRITKVEYDPYYTVSVDID